MNQPVLTIVLNGRVLVASCVECGAFVAGSHCLGALAIAARRHVCGVRKRPERQAAPVCVAAAASGK